MQVSEIKKIFHLELDTIYNKEEVTHFFYLMLEKYLKLDRFVLVMQPNLTVSKEEEEPFFEALAQLKLERPLQYIFGEASFMDLTFKVNESVLIPRPETEELVSWVIDYCLIERSRNLRILDIGTGSGCIAIALAKAIPNAKITALDVSEKALIVAKENAKRNNVELELILIDILDLNKVQLEDFDIIVSNPPYVRELEKDEIKRNVKDNEPSLALFVPDDNPLLFYKSIAEFSKNHLSKEGRVYLEINQYLGEETKELFENENFKEVILKKDIFGNNRLLKCIKNF